MRPRRPRCRCSPAIAFARRTAASRCSSPTAAPCISTPTRSSTFSRTRSSGCSSGRVRLNIAGTDAERRVPRRRAVRLGANRRRPGEYRVAVATGNEIELAVLRGAAELVNEDGRTPLGAGERAFARAGARPIVCVRVQFGRVGRLRSLVGSAARARLGVSAEYLPETVQPYASTFNTYGSWRSEPTYGHVWYPRVASGLASVLPRPLDDACDRGDGRGLAPTRGRGRRITTAAGDSRPARGSGFPARTWGPAWVSWAYAPGYVSWCPLGWNNRPVFSVINVNVYRRTPLQSVARVDGRAASRLRPRRRQRQRRQCHAHRRAHARARSSSATRRRTYRGYAVPRSRSADSQRWHATSVRRQ